jgi:hypothetical protein
VTYERVSPVTFAAKTYQYYSVVYMCKVDPHKKDSSCKNTQRDCVCESDVAPTF